VTALDRLSSRLRGTSDVALALLALGAVSLLVAPLPAWLLDLCIAANLALAATILVVALSARDALRFTSLPTVLLLTTLFRLALEVGSTRLVLSRGDAGRVIQAFGRVVVGGDYVVGAVVYAILTLAQILVVAKGAERVAEVAARFTLDAMPGKQMSVDADLRAGAIDQEEARRRRRALEREGQLHGAMDGALKFVKGDAIAGVVVVLVNVTGGLVAGLSRGLPLEVAARRYALLAIGDGLVAQIPALLVSVAAGVVVTRVASEQEGRSLADDLAQQLLADPRALAAVAALCGLVAAVPGLPAAPFMVLGAAALLGAWFLDRRGAREARDRGAPAEPGPGVAPLPLALELSSDLAALAGGASGRFAREMLPAVQQEVARELGVAVPAIALRRDDALGAGGWRLLLEDVPVAAGRAPVDEAIALAAPAELDAVGIPALADLDPVSGGRVARIAAAQADRAGALAPVRGPLERVGASLATAIRAHAYLLVGVQEVQALLDGLEASHPALVREASRQIPAHVLADVLRQLLEEGIPVRPLRRILEALLEAGVAGRNAPALADCCRKALRCHIAHGHARAGALEALLLDPAADAALREVLDPRDARALLARIDRELRAHDATRPPVLLASPDVRRALRQIVAPRFPRLAVLSYEELPPSLAVRPIGKIALEPE
jgi:type III secretion protein V